MIQISSIHEMKATSFDLSQSGATTALVPTMGNLHDGHLSLVHEAKKHADKVIVSIFVNPTQFGPKEDFNTYPRTIDEDLHKLTGNDVDYVFCPSRFDIYGPDEEGSTRVTCPTLDQTLCSKSRPHFFTGVATIVIKLLNITKPTMAFFGEKDYQQLLIIRKVAQDLFINTEIRSCPIVREPSGLALSSRNRYLTQAELKIAPNLYKVLTLAKQDIDKRTASKITSNYLNSIIDHASMALTEYGFKVDYFDIVNSETLKAPTHFSQGDSLLIATATYLDKTRLVDNQLIILK